MLVGLLDSPFKRFQDNTVIFFFVQVIPLKNRLTIMNWLNHPNSSHFIILLRYKYPVYALRIENEI